VDAGRGWLIFGLPPAEAAFHPSEESGVHELYLLCDDLKAEMASLAAKGVTCSEVQEAGWGSIVGIAYHYVVQRKAPKWGASEALAKLAP
jgi:hypothetical protein